MSMRWHDLAFLHWPVEAAALRPFIWPRLELDTFEGQAWLGVTPFRMTRVRPRWLPPAPALSAFPELNVRTYVTEGGKPGVWFLSLDAGNPVAVWLARWTFHLPYYRARMSCVANDGGVTYKSLRTHRGAHPASFVGRYEPAGDVYRSRRGTLEYWLTERYCLYTVARGILYRGEIHHAPWPLQAASVEIEANTMAEATGLRLPRDPSHTHFARELDVVAWMLERV
jgi:uncharacterized protein YqjF (DUF2071 family)